MCIIDNLSHQLFNNAIVTNRITLFCRGILTYLIHYHYLRLNLSILFFLLLSDSYTQVICSTNEKTCVNICFFYNNKSLPDSWEEKIIYPNTFFLDSQDNISLHKKIFHVDTVQFHLLDFSDISNVYFSLCDIIERYPSQVISKNLSNIYIY